MIENHQNYMKRKFPDGYAAGEAEGYLWAYLKH